MYRYLEIVLISKFIYCPRFAHYRDVREHIHNFNAVVASCLLIAYEELSATADMEIKVNHDH